MIIHYQKRKIILPGSYNELSARQMIAIAALLQLQESEDVLRLKALQILSGYGQLRFCLFPADLKARIIENVSLIDWVFKENTLTAQLLPEYKGFHGAKGEFDNTTLAEFHFTEVAYQEFVTGEEKEKELNTLIAVLYRKPKFLYNKKQDKDGDSRQHFNANLLPYNSRKIADWPLNVKLAILMFYDGCRQHLASSYEAIFKGRTGGDNKAGMFSIIRGLAGTKYGDFDKVEDLNIHTALSDIEEQMAEAKAVGG